MNKAAKLWRFGLGVVLSLVLVLGGALEVRAQSVRSVALETKDLIYDPNTRLIYASVPGSVAGRGNSITPVDPITGAIGASVFVGSEPGKLARSDNGQYLYVTLDGAAAVRRFDLATQTAGLQFSLGSDSFLGPFYAEDIEVLPGSPESVAISLRNQGFSPRHEGVAIFDNGVKRPTQTPGHTGSNVIEFSASAAILYGYNNETTDFGLRTMAVDASGVTVTKSASNLFSGFNLDFDYSDGLLYSTNGVVVNPTTSTPVGTFSGVGFGSDVEPDSASGRVFFVTGSGSSLAIKAYDRNTFALLGTIPIAGAVGEGRSLIRWGSDGLAFRTTGGGGFSGFSTSPVRRSRTAGSSATVTTGSQIFLVQSPLIGASPTLTLQITPATFGEDAGSTAATGTVTRNTSTAGDLVVTLTSSDLGVAKVPPSVTIPAGQTSATFPISATDDEVVDGPQTSVITATATGFAAGAVTVTVTDNDVAPTPTPSPTPVPGAVLSIVVAQSTLDENAASIVNRPAAKGRVSRSVADETALTVSLSSNDLSELRVPGSVVIAAGETSAEFVLTPVDDAVADGPQRVTITATADGYDTRPTAIVTVRDNEVPALNISVSPGRVVEGGSFTLVVRRNVELTRSTPALRVLLSASPLRQLALPGAILIPAHTAAISFRVATNNDSASNGPRTVTLLARAIGYTSASTTVVVQDNEAGSNLTIGGRVTTAATAGSLPVGGVLLTLKSGATVLDSTVSAANGQYAFRQLPVGTYQIVASKNGVTFTPSARSVTLVGSSRSNLDFVATLRSQISGSVLRSNGDGTRSPLANVLVTAQYPTLYGTLTFCTRTNPNGSFLFDGVPLAVYKVAPELGGTSFTPASRVVRLDAANSSATGLLFIAAPAPQEIVQRDAGHAQAVIVAPTSSVVLSSATADAASDTITLHFSASLDAERAADASLFSVSIDGVLQPVEAAAGSGNTVTLTLPEGALKLPGKLLVNWSGLLDTRQRVLKDGGVLVPR